MNIKRLTIVIVFAAGLCASVVVFFVINGSDASPARTNKAQSQETQAQAIQGETDFGLPILEINTIDGAFPVSDSKETTFEAIMNIRDSVINPTNGALYSGKIRLKLRGNSTLNAPKKSWNIKLDSKASLLTLPSISKDYVLNANYTDPSLMRNYLAYELARDIGDYATKLCFVSVVMNGEYIGTYTLGEKITLEDGRLGESGILVEKMWAGKAISENELTFNTERVTESHCFVIAEPSGIVYNDEAYLQISEYMQKFESVLYSDEFCSATNGWKTFADAESVADYYIINELFKNVDALSFSAFFYKPVNGLLQFGPIWDFDISSGMDFYNSRGDDSAIFNSPAGFLLKDYFYMPRFFEDPEFEALVKVRWKQFYNTAIPQMFVRIDETADLLALSNEQNFKKWHVFDETSGRKNYMEEVQYLTWWLHARAEWLNAQWGK